MTFKNCYIFYLWPNYGSIPDLIIHFNKTLDGNKDTPITRASIFYTDANKSRKKCCKAEELSKV